MDADLAFHGGAPTRDRMLVFGAPLIGPEEIDEVVATLKSGWIGFGPKCQLFEERFATYTNSTHAVSTSSCTASLQIALRMCGIGPGDDVITTPMTFAATANVIELAGARPVLVDIERHTQNIDPRLVAHAVTDRVRACIPVHMCGRPCDMAAIRLISTARGIEVIEDAAHAIESQHTPYPGGSESRFKAFSFYATKNLTTGEGGMLTCRDEADADRARTLRLHGLTRHAWQRFSEAGWTPYDVLEPGYKYNMTDLQASLGLHQLARLEQSLEVRERHWAAYDRAFSSLDEVETPAPAEPGRRHSRHLYTLILRPDRLRRTRGAIISALRAEGVGTGVHFVPIHLHPYYAEKYGFVRGMFPNAEYIGDNTVSLPMSAALSDADVDDVVRAVHKVIASSRTVRVNIPFLPSPQLPA
jgi:dTDP-4-amino-4,6-dideoxygalactose transaminase